MPSLTQSRMYKSRFGVQNHPALAAESRFLSHVSKNQPLKPSRRPRLNKAHLGLGEFYDGCDLKINKFYGVPAGTENWTVKEIKDRSLITANRPAKTQTRSDFASMLP